MADYSLMYKKLFNTVTDAIRILQTAQAETEEMYISQEEARIMLLNPGADEINGNGSET